MNKIIFTIGYSVFKINHFIELLKNYNIGVIADVRSYPYSKYKPEFCRENLKQRLKAVGISYVFLGKECGARPEDQSVYVDGKVDFNLLAKHPLFIKGIERLRHGINNYRIALLCAEKDPIICHRTILVCRNLLTDNLTINHILANGQIESNMDFEKRLFAIHFKDQPMLQKILVDKAYDLQAKRIAYSK
jgi:uncharacterized protein (DUF488 family)